MMGAIISESVGGIVGIRSRGRQSLTHSRRGTRPQSGVA